MVSQGQEDFLELKVKMDHLDPKDHRAQEACLELKDPREILAQPDSQEMLVAQDLQVLKVWMDCQESMETLVH